MFQFPKTLNRTALENVEYPLKLRGAPREERRERARDMLLKTGLARFANRNARELSGGEQQLLALARAWATEPEVLFLDEPTGSLDPQSTFEVEELIRAIAAAGTKIIMTSHDLAQVRRLADEIVFLLRGRLVEAGRAEQVLEDPQAEETAAFLKGELLL